MSTLTDREYDSELRRLHDQLLVMGAKVEEMIDGSMRALTQRDTELARRLIDFDHQINRLEVEIDDLCLRILARRQPVASDLRFITIALKLVTDLERMGDLGVNICERVIELNMEAPLKPYVGLPLMAKTAQGMIRDALDAFVSGNVDAAREVVERDRVVDAYYAQMFRELLTYMMEDTRNIYRAIRAQAIAKYLERIGDHATNVAEMVIFMAMGKDVRHLGSMAEPSALALPRGVLFLCTDNSARSPMADAIARQLLPPGVRILSGGSAPMSQVNPHAVQVMKEVGIDISGHQPRALSDVPWGDVDLVVTLGEEACVVPASGMQCENWNLPDPTTATGSEEGVLAAFRSTRDELKARIAQLAARTLKSP